MTLRYLVDTNVLSLLDARRADQRGHLAAWLQRRGAELALSAITLTEIENGLLKLRRRGQGARADEIAALAAAVQTEFHDRILSLDAEVAVRIARLADKIRPLTIELPDLIIAATADVHGLAVLTRNVRHIAPTGVATIDPVTQPPDEAK